MKNLITILIILFATTLSWGQEDFIPKFDGTKYYMLIYDGDKNEKVLTYKTGKGWNEAIGYSDYFDGSNGQLWVFEVPDQHPGFINVRNLHESLSNKHFLKSWSWYAYLEEQSGAREGDQEHDLELVYRFQHIFDGWQALETIEKPKGLYGIDYTPGADALNIDANGVASFNGVKTSEITPENAVNKVFKLVEFDPMALFIDAIERGQQMYDEYTHLSDVVRNEYFYILEKARETRVFGTEAQMLAFQPAIDEATSKFISFTNLSDAVTNALTFIEESEADSETRASFQNVISRIQDFMNGDEIDYTKINRLKADIEGAQNLVNAIVAAEIVRDTLSNHEDTRLAGAMTVAIRDAKNVLASAESTSENYNSSVSILSKMDEFLSGIIAAKELVIQTEGFEEAKQILIGNIDEALVAANTSGIDLEKLTAAVKKLQADVKAFKKALEAGDTVIAIQNPGFENAFEKWNSVTDTEWIPYTQDDGIDKSKNMAYWNSVDYHVMTYQSIYGIPNGKYQISMMAVVSDNGISFFAQSGESSIEDSLAFEDWSYSKRTIEIDVTDGTLKFGVKGSGPENMIPANVWGIFDDFEVKWLSTIEIQNPGFEELLEGWTSNSDTEWIPYTQDDGVEGSKNMAYWNSVDYHVITSQTVIVPNGKYQVGMWAKISQPDYISLFAQSGENTNVTLLQESASAYAKSTVEITVNDGMLTFGIKGSGEDNLIPANVWGTFDNFEVVRLPDIDIVNPEFEDDFFGWTKNSDTDWMPYIENKGVDGSKSVTYWQSVDHHVSTFQTVSNLFNGEYEINAMTFTGNNNSYLLFGQSGGEEHSTSILSSGGLVKYKVVAEVTDNTLTFGIRGSGENNMVPANHWIVFDNFEIIIKSILPEYDTDVQNVKAKEMITSSEINEQNVDVNTMIWWQDNDMLNVRTNNPMSVLTVYSITGAKVTEIKPYSNTVAIALKSGIYILKILTERNSVATEKVILK
jgi:cytochrome c556